ncbi:MAG: histidine triad nucleotide-binding protein [Patescibacteria group bacterium]|jgi:histidine triad (HIT) family protein
MEDCLFCKIARGEIPAKKRFEDDEFVAFDDINPKAQTHILIIPKKHITSVIDLMPEDEGLMGRLILRAQSIAEKSNLSQDGYRLCINSGRHSGQEVDHLHLHLIGGNPLGPIA